MKRTRDELRAAILAACKEPERRRPGRPPRRSTAGDVYKVALQIQRLVLKKGVTQTQAIREIVSKLTARDSTKRSLPRKPLAKAVATFEHHLEAPAKLGRRWRALLDDIIKRK